MGTIPKYCTFYYVDISFKERDKRERFCASKLNFEFVTNTNMPTRSAKEKLFRYSQLFRCCKLKLEKGFYMVRPYKQL